MPQTPDTTLKLGSFVFKGLEIPENIRWGGEQMLVVHKLVGGTRIVHPMGRDDAPLEWTGRFMGQQAFDRAQTLDTMRITGREIQLSWGALRYSVVIKAFVADYTRFYNIPYTITCEVVEDLANPTAKAATSSIDGVIRGATKDANFFSQLLNDTGIQSVVDTVVEAVDAVEDFASATIDQINSVIQPVVAAQAYVQQVIQQVGVNTGNILSLGGVFPNSLSESAFNLVDQATTFGNLGDLYNLGNSLGVVGVNVNSLGNIGEQVDLAGRSLTTAGGNLFGIAAEVYGDATKWAGIADKNDISDPQLDGITTLQLPANVPDTGGILGE